MKKILAILCATLLFMTGVSAVSAENDDIKVTLNGNPITFDVPPQIINNRTMVPLRAVFEAMGAMVFWYNDDFDNHICIEIQLNGKYIDLKIGSNAMHVNLAEMPIDSPPCIIDGRTLVPVRAISEALDAYVKWNETSKTVEIDYRQTSPLPVNGEQFSSVLNGVRDEAIYYFEKETLANKKFAINFVTYWYVGYYIGSIRIPGVRWDIDNSFNDGDVWDVVGSTDELNSQYRLLFGCDLPNLTEEDMIREGGHAHIYDGKYVAYPWRGDGDPPTAVYNHAEEKLDGSYDLIFNYLEEVNGDFGYTDTSYEDVFNISLTDNENGFIINSYRGYKDGVLQPLYYED